MIDGVLTTGPSASSRLDALADVARDASIANALAAARELLGMDLAYLAEADEQEFRFAAIDGDGASFGGVAAELRIPRHDTLCDRMSPVRYRTPSATCPRLPGRRTRSTRPPSARMWAFPSASATVACTARCAASPTARRPRWPRAT